MPKSDIEITEKESPMGFSNTIIIEKEPFWLLEAVQCLNSVYILDSDEWLEEKSYWNRERKESFLVPYRRYRDAMRKELLPVFEKYPAVMYYIDTEVRKPETLTQHTLPLVEFLQLVNETAGDLLMGDSLPEKEVLRDRLNRIFERMLLDEGSESQEGEALSIHSLADVITVLEKAEMADSYKFKMIRLYSEAASLFGQLRELQKQSAEIGRRCLPFVQERYEQFLQTVRGFQSPQELLGEQGALQIQDDNCIFYVSPGIISCRTAVFLFDGDDSADALLKAMCYIGIEVFYLANANKETPQDDEELLKTLKAVSDPTRLNILHLLAREASYLQELARKLELTPATVSHHLGILLDAELIVVQMETGRKKVFYRIKPENLEKLGRNISRLGLAPGELAENDVRKENPTWTLPVK